jgi:hypothetical protein
MPRAEDPTSEPSGEHAVVFRQLGLYEEKTCFHGIRRRC